MESGPSLSVAVSVPKRLYEEARRRGIDVESRVVEVLLRELELDPVEGARVRLELAAKFLREGVELVDKDPVQAGEKLYKSAEECVKALAEALGLEEAEARRRGRWTLGLLDSAARRLGESVDRRVYDDWSHAYFLHVEGFQEARLTAEQIKARAKYVSELLEISNRVVRERTGS